MDLDLFTNMAESDNSVSVVTPTTLSPTLKSTNVALSGGNLIATFGVDHVHYNVSSIVGLNSGKFHVEMTALAVGSEGPYAPCLGISGAAWPFDDYGGGGESWIGRAGPTGPVYDNIASIWSQNVYYPSGWPVMVNGAVVAMEVDLDNNLVFFQRAGYTRSTGYAIPWSGTRYVRVNGGYDGGVARMNFGQLAMTVPVTSGFAAGWG